MLHTDEVDVYAITLCCCLKRLHILGEHVLTVYASSVICRDWLHLDPSASVALVPIDDFSLSLSGWSKVVDSVARSANWAVSILSRVVPTVSSGGIYKGC